MLSKECQQCKVVFFKPYSRSVRDWNTRARFCSRQCADIAKTGQPSCSPATTFKKGQIVLVPLSSRKRGAENNKWKGGQISLKCKMCGLEFKVDPYLKDTAKYCSKICHDEFQRLPAERIKRVKSKKSFLKTIPN